MIEALYHQVIAGNKTQTRRSGGLEEVNGRKATKSKPAILTNPNNWKLGARIVGVYDSSKDLFPAGIADFFKPGPIIGYEFVPKDAGIIEITSAGNLLCNPRNQICFILYFKIYRFRSP
jgi:hypothetical protein